MDAPRDRCADAAHLRHPTRVETGAGACGLEAQQRLVLPEDCGPARARTTPPARAEPAARGPFARKILMLSVVSPFRRPVFHFEVKGNCEAIRYDGSVEGARRCVLNESPHAGCRRGAGAAPQFYTTLGGWPLSRPGARCEMTILSHPTWHWLCCPSYPLVIIRGKRAR